MTMLKFLALGTSSLLGLALTAMMPARAAQGARRAAQGQEEGRPRDPEAR